MNAPTPDEMMRRCEVLCGIPKSSISTGRTAAHVYARRLFMLASANAGLQIAEAAELAGMELPEARAAIGSATKSVKTSAKFKAMLAEVEDPNPMYWGDNDSTYTKEERDAMRSACLSAVRFMQGFGKGKNTRRPVVDGVGFYPVPTTLP